MRIVYLLTTPDSGAGTERTILTQAGLMASRHKVEVLGVYRTLDHSHHSVDRRVRRRYLVDARAGIPEGRSRLVPSEWDNQFSDVTDKALESVLRRLRADVVVTSTPALAALATEFVPARTVVVHQEHRPAMHRNDGIGPLLSHGARIDLLTNLTMRSQVWLQERLGESAPPMMVVENPREPGFLPRTTLANRLIVGAGRFTYQKRFGDLIRAFAIADGDEPGWKLRIFGEGYERSQLRALVDTYGLLGKVEIVSPTQRMAAELSKASIFGLSSRYEGLPMVGIEAAAAGVPMVAYDVETGPAEIIGKAGGGLLAPDGSVEALGSSLAHFMGNRDALVEASEKALVGAKAFDPDAIAQQWFGIFDRVSGSRSHGLISAQQASPVEHPVAEPSSEEGDDFARLKAVEAKAVDAPSVAMQAHLEQSVEAALRDVGVEHAWLATAESRRDIVVSADDREAALTALMGLVTTQAWEMCAFRGTGALSATPWSHPADAPVTLSRASRVAISATHHGGTSTAQIGVEFWNPDENGVMHAVRRNANAEWVSAEAWKQWVESGADTISGLPLWKHVRFPIDVVFTWVDGDDPDWASRRRAVRGEAASAQGKVFDNDAVRAARFTNREEIYFAVRAVKKFAPWVRNIFVVTDQQRPDRVLAEFPDVRIVDHQEIFPDTSVLPVFNSHAIETCLHRIDGLAEHFLYFNDDVILTSPLQPEDVFLGNGAAKFFASGIQVNYGAFDDTPHLAAASNNRRLIAKDFGMEITQSMLHTPYPHRRSVLAEIEQRYADEINRTRAGQFRSGSDLSLTSSFAQYYGYATERYVPGYLKYTYVSLRGAGLFDRMKRVLTDQSLQVIALGEPHDSHWRHPQERALVEEFLTRLTD